MNTDLKKIFTNLALYNGIILLLNIFLFETFLKSFFFPIYYVSFGIFLVLTILHCIILVKYSKQRIALFTRMFMLSTSVKFFVLIIYITLYIFLQKEKAVPFLLHTLVLYFLFTIFEVISMYKYFINIRSSNGQQIK
jgi:hypothetical protein